MHLLKLGSPAGLIHQILTESPLPRTAIPEIPDLWGLQNNEVVGVRSICKIPVATTLLGHVDTMKLICRETRIRFDFYEGSMYIIYVVVKWTTLQVILIKSNILHLRPFENL